MAGSRVFTVEDGELTLALAPALPGWLFDEQGNLSFTFPGARRSPITTLNGPIPLEQSGR